MWLCSRVFRRIHPDACGYIAADTPPLFAAAGAELVISPGSNRTDLSPRFQLPDDYYVKSRCKGYCCDR
jgi:hypothetical protein